MNILVIAAHPDDEVLGCGGTMAQRAAEGHAVSVLILGEGITSRYEDPTQADAEELATLHDHAQKAGSMLGAQHVTVADFPDNRFDTVPLLHIVHRIEEEMDRVQPEVVYTQHGGDLNIDHVCTFRATMTATRATHDCSVRAVYAYEVRSSTEWSHQQFAPVFQATTFVDIGATLEKKIEAMECYESEARAFPHPRSPQSLQATAEYWGSVSGVRAAEAFQLIRSIE